MQQTTLAAKSYNTDLLIMTRIDIAIQQGFLSDNDTINTIMGNLNVIDRMDKDIEIFIKKLQVFSGVSSRFIYGMCVSKNSDDYHKLLRNLDWIAFGFGQWAAQYYCKIPILDFPNISLWENVVNERINLALTIPVGTTSKLFGVIIEMLDGSRQFGMVNAFTNTQALEFVSNEFKDMDVLNIEIVDDPAELLNEQYRGFGILTTNY